MKILERFLNIFVQGTATIGTIAADTVSEKTAGSGVTVDGLLLKDSQVQMAWTDYTPSYGCDAGSIALNTKTYARYSPHGRGIFLHLALSVDITVAPAAYITISLPSGLNAASAAFTGLVGLNGGATTDLALGFALASTLAIYVNNSTVSSWPVGTNHKVYICQWYAMA